MMLKVGGKQKMVKSYRKKFLNKIQAERVVLLRWQVFRNCLDWEIKVNLIRNK